MSSPAKTEVTTPPLLPCPFCGADAAAKMYSRDELFKVECNGCGAEMRGFDQCKQDAIDAWNTRAGAAEPVAWRWQKPFGEVGEWQITKDKPTNAFRMLEPLYR